MPVDIHPRSTKQVKHTLVHTLIHTLWWFVTWIFMFLLKEEGPQSLPSLQDFSFNQNMYMFIRICLNCFLFQYYYYYKSMRCSPHWHTERHTWTQLSNVICGVKSCYFNWWSYVTREIPAKFFTLQNLMCFSAATVISGGGDSSVVRAPDSWLKGRGFESLLEQRENFLLQGRLSVLTLISVSIPPPCYHSST